MNATLTKEQLRDRFEAAIRIKRGAASYLTDVRNDGEYVEAWAACAFDGFCMAHASGDLVSVPAAELEALRRDRDRLNSADQLCKKFMHGTYQGYSWSDGHEEETPGFVLSFKKRGIRQAIDAATKART